MPKQSINFHSTVCGIPCGISIDSYLCVPPFKGNAHDCDSADDYYGYTEAEFTILDRKGYIAPWLEAKLTSDDEARITEEITEYKQEI